MDVIFRLISHLTEEDFLLLMDAWDNEFKEYMLQSENHCSKFMMGHIEWSPVIGIWLNRRWLLHSVCLWMIGTGCPDTRNMFRECYRLHLPDPRTSTHGAVCTQIMVTEQEIWHILKDGSSVASSSLTSLKLPRSMKTQSKQKQYFNFLSGKNERNDGDR
jgi:hypothetical protein